MKCPFRNKDNIKQFWLLVDLYMNKTGHLFLNGEPNCGNGFATDFWGGYNGRTEGIFNYSDKSSRNQTGYIWYKTGKTIKEAGL